MKVGDLVRDRGRYAIGVRSDGWYYDYDEYYGWDWDGSTTVYVTSPPAVFIKWHIVDGEEEGEFYSCAKVLRANGSVGNILRHNLEVISESR